MPGPYQTYFAGQNRVGDIVGEGLADAFAMYANNKRQKKLDTEAHDKEQREQAWQNVLREITMQDQGVVRNEDANPGAMLPGSGTRRDVAMPQVQPNEMPDGSPMLQATPRSMAPTPGAFDPASGTFAPLVPRFQRMGNTGFSRDMQNTPEAKRLAQVMAEREMAEQAKVAERDRVSRSYVAAGMNPTQANAAVENPQLADNFLFPKPEKSEAPVTGSPEWLAAQEALAKLRAKYRTPSEKPDPTQVVVTPDGIALVDKKNATSRRVAAPGEAVAEGGGQLQASQRNPLRVKAIENRTKLRTIDEALASLDQHPDAVGLKRGVPVIGDLLNQRYDKEGVGTRAAIADIGSLILHDRSGAAITVSEMPRLAPFVPRVIDTKEAARTKLLRLKSLVEEETEALEAGGGSGAVPASKANSIAAKYGITPSVP